MSEVVGCTTSRSVWLPLESAFSHSSVSRAQQLREELLFLRRGDLSVADFGRKFKSLCDQLVAIGKPVDDTNKGHWFLRGLGPQFSGFSDTRMVMRPMPGFRELLNQAVQFDIFMRTMEPVPAAAFVASHHPLSKGLVLHNVAHPLVSPMFLGAKFVAASTMPTNVLSIFV